FAKNIKEEQLTNQSKFSDSMVKKGLDKSDRNEVYSYLKENNIPFSTIKQSDFDYANNLAEQKINNGEKVDYVDELKRNLVNKKVDDKIIRRNEKIMPTANLNTDTSPIKNSTPKGKDVNASRVHTS